jgi:aconitate hydratase
MPARSVAEKLIASHLSSEVGSAERELTVGAELALRVDQTLTQDATGTLVMLALEAMEAPRVSTELSVQYVDHNLIQEDFKNPDDHLFLESACQRFGVVFARAVMGFW